jgi:hypothetical protein
MELPALKHHSFMFQGPGMCSGVWCCKQAQGGMVVAVLLAQCVTKCNNIRSHGWLPARSPTQGVHGMTFAQAWHVIWVPGPLWGGLVRKLTETLICTLGWFRLVALGASL